jgi:chaperonin cofactor prefoldin
MALPRQVQAQLAEVEELEKTLKAQKEPKKKKAKTPEVSEEPTDTEADVLAETEVAAQPGEVTPTDTSPTDATDEFEQKYKTLQGKYDAEVPRLHQQVRDMTTQLDMFQKELKAKSEAPPKPKEKVSFVTDEDRAEFGEELIDVQTRIAKEVAQEYESRLEQQGEIIKALQDKIAETGSQVGEMGFTQRLQSLVPDFANIDNDERWVAWLNEHDPMLRGPRRDQAAAAFNAGDAEAVAHYVKLWKESIAGAEPEPRPNRQSELEKQVAPNRSASSVRTQSAGQDQKIWSAREVQSGWDKIRVMNTRHQYDEANKLEATLTAAYIEGRVRA